MSLRTIKEGEATKSVYLVCYNEDQWMRYSDKQKQECYDFWIKRAEPMEVEEAILRLYPDELFPQHGHELPYIAWRHKFPPRDSKGWELAVTVRVYTNDNAFILTDSDRDKFKQYWTKYPKGTRFLLKNLQNKTLWEHTT